MWQWDSGIIEQSKKECPRDPAGASNIAYFGTTSHPGLIKALFLRVNFPSQMA